FASGDGLAHDRIVLVGGGDNFQFATIHHEPDPAAAEAPDAARFKLFLERVEAAEGGLDVVAQFAAGRATGFWSHQFPKHRVVVMAAAVVAHRTADVVGN